MPNLKQMRKRIDSVRSTRKITYAMKMVAASKLRRAQAAILATRPYALEVNSLIHGLSETLDDYLHPLMIPHDSVKRVGVLVITSDRGMCGALNSGVARNVESLMREKSDTVEEFQLATMGRKGHEYFKRRNANIRHSFPDIYKEHGIEAIQPVANRLIHDYLTGEVDEVWVVFTRFNSVISQEVRRELLLPIISVEPTGKKHDIKDYTYEPDRRTILEELVPQDIEIQLYRYFLESQASEHGARMTAMEGATRNAEEMIDKLTLLYNRTRQAVITNELVEIVSGAEALKG